MFFPHQKRLRSHPTGEFGLMVLSSARNVAKLTATTQERVTQANAPNRAAHTTNQFKKGPFKGMLFVTLSNEEITTCPDSCPFKQAYLNKETN